MKPKDLLRAMNDVDPALLEQSIHGEEPADSMKMNAEHPVAEVRESRITRIVGTAASLAACAAIVTGGILWLIHASAQKPQVAGSSSIETVRATATEPTGMENDTTVQTHERKTEPTGTEIAPETQTGERSTEPTVTGTDYAPGETEYAPGTKTTTTTVQLTGTDTHTTSNPVMTFSSQKTTPTSQAQVTDRPPQSSTEIAGENGFPCAVTPKIWNTSWCEEQYWRSGQPLAMIIRSTQQMEERNAVDDRTYVYENCGFANDEFFRDYDLIVCAMQSGTGSIEVGVENLMLLNCTHPVKGKSKMVMMTLAQYIPECCTCDMATVCIAIPVPKGLLPEDVQTVTVSVDHYDVHFDENDNRIPDVYERYQAMIHSPVMFNQAEALLD